MNDNEYGTDHDIVGHDYGLKLLSKSVCQLTGTSISAIVWLRLSVLYAFIMVSAKISEVQITVRHGDLVVTLTTST